MILLIQWIVLCTSIYSWQPFQVTHKFLVKILCVAFFNLFKNIPTELNYRGHKTEIKIEFNLHTRLKKCEKYKYTKPILWTTEMRRKERWYEYIGRRFVQREKECSKSIQIHKSWKGYLFIFIKYMLICLASFPFDLIISIVFFFHDNMHIPAPSKFRRSHLHATA